MNQFNSVIKDVPAFELEAIDGTPLNNILGYYLTSTATIHVEDMHVEPDENSLKPKIRTLAQHLIDTDNPQLTISIHGYANKKSDSVSRTNKIYNYATGNSRICQFNNVFVGYRWPAENIIKDDPDIENPQGTSFKQKIGFTLQSLPTLLLAMLTSCLALSVVTVGLLVFRPISANLILTFALALLLSAAIFLTLTKLANATLVLRTLPNLPILLLFATTIAAIATGIIHLPIPANSLLAILATFYTLFVGIILALIALKLVTYPSDRFRATNYAVIDLVEFIKQVEREIITELCTKLEVPKERCSAIRKIEDFKHEPQAIAQSIKLKRIRLSFINHSLGCEVVTQTLRILSDVFDPSLRNEGEPSSNIGGVFTLGRIVLVAPDIPLESILSSRSNFLKSALRRCEEAYVFSNEGDLALRLASTAANYFSFPSRSRFRGYKLGNITVKPSPKASSIKDDANYGILNNISNQSPNHLLEIRSSQIERKGIDELFKLKEEEKAVADYFTYFDCTDYVDPENRNKGILSFALRKSALNLWFDYIRLSIAYFLAQPRKIDVHGAYFDGEFSQKLIYELAFLGYLDFLNINFHQSIDRFSNACRDAGIKVLLTSQELPNAPPGVSPSNYLQ